MVVYCHFPIYKFHLTYQNVIWLCQCSWSDRNTKSSVSPACWPGPEITWDEPIPRCMKATKTWTAPSWGDVEVAQGHQPKKCQHYIWDYVDSFGRKPVRQWGGVGHSAPTIYPSCSDLLVWEKDIQSLTIARQVFSKWENIPIDYSNSASPVIKP